MADSTGSTGEAVEGDEDVRTPSDPARIDTGRVLALSDGVFAIASTLLVLDLRLPDDLRADQLDEALHTLLPAAGGYALSYLLIGILWFAHHRIFQSLAFVTGRIARLNILFLGLVSVLPFVTSTLARFGSQPLATQLYAATTTAIFALEVGIVALARHEHALADHEGALRLAARAVGAGLVFAISVGIAVASPSAAKYSWLLVIPARRLGNWAATRRHRWRRDRRSQD